MDEQLNIAKQIKKEIQERYDILKMEKTIQENVNSIIEQQLKNTEGVDNTFVGIIKKKLESLDISENESLVEEQLKVIESQREEIIKRLVDEGKELKSTQLDILEIQETYLKYADKRLKGQEELNDLTTQYTDSIKDSIGLNSELVEVFGKGGLMAVGVMFISKAITGLIGYLKEGVGRAIEMQKSMGIGAANAAKFEANILQAKLSMDGLLFSMDELREASLAVTEATGNIIVPPETIQDVAELNSLLKDPQVAVSLQRTLKNAGVDAGNLTDNIKEMASSMGVDASSAIEYLAENQLELGGMTEEQIKQRAQEGLMLKKMGADMKELNRLASESLDIETSLRNEMKLRMMTGKEINLNELRAAQASGDTTAIAQAQSKLVSQLGDDLHSNLQIQRLISDATGMSKEQLLSYDNASKENKKTQEDLLKLKDEYGLADIEQAKTLQLQQASMKDMLTTGGMVVGGLVVMVGLMKVLSPLMKKMLPSGDSKKGNPVSNFMKSMGGKDVLKGAAAMLVISASLLVTAKALNEFNTVEWGSLGKAGLALLGLVGAVAALGTLMSSGVGTIAILAGSAAILTIASSMVVLGAGMKLINNNIAGLENLVPLLSSLVLLSPGLLALSGSLTLLSASLMTLSVGLAAVGVFLPVLGALSSVGILGGGDDTTESGDSGMGDLLNEVKGLRQDIQSQPIMINVDGRVVSQISRVQRKQNSVSKSGYGG